MGLLDNLTDRQEKGSNMRIVKLNGSTAGIFKNNDDNTKLTISGWSRSYRDIKENEKILLVTSRGQESCYTVTKVENPMQPADQFFFDCIFTPRF